MTTLTEALTATLARRDADELAALRADLAHALGVRDAAMEAEDKAVAERAALRAQRDALQATLCDLAAAFDKRGAQRDAAVEALRWLACPPDPSSNSRMSKYAADALDALLARGTP